MGTPWTSEEEDVIKRFVDSRGRSEIAAMLGRSRGAITRRVEIMRNEGKLPKFVPSDKNLCAKCQSNPRQVSGSGFVRSYCGPCSNEDNYYYRQTSAYKKHRLKMRKKSGLPPSTLFRINHATHNHLTKREREKCRERIMAEKNQELGDSNAAAC